MRTTLLIFLIILTSCTVGPGTDYSIEQLKTACNNACGGQSEVTVTLYPVSEVYTTDQAICIKRTHDEQTRLYCGTCSCGSYGPAPGNILRSEAESTVTCTFTDNGSEIKATC